MVNEIPTFKTNTEKLQYEKSKITRQYACVYQTICMSQTCVSHHRKETRWRKVKITKGRMAKAQRQNFPYYTKLSGLP